MKFAGYILTAIAAFVLGWVAHAAVVKQLRNKQMVLCNDIAPRAGKKIVLEHTYKNGKSDIRCYVM